MTKIGIYVACGTWWFFPHSMTRYANCVNDALACLPDMGCLEEVLKEYRSPCERLIP